MQTSELRRAFLRYFEEQGHRIVDSSPLVPANDPSLLFTNAGMVQFKDVFLGVEERNYRRATTSQRCVRAGGKHNDLDNVGYTARHHTFFEMLGNFSFGDYFKREAIGFGWELLTQRFGLPPEQLWVTVYERDDEAADIWLDEVGVDRKRFSRCGEKDNFWIMGDTGPCGPCSEIFYDHGPDIVGGPPGSLDEDGDRYVEIWNLVFMQYEREPGGALNPIPRPSVDTGMGLERIAAVMQGVHDNYDIDLFKRLLDAIRAIMPREDVGAATSMRVIADHIRSAAFLILDGVFPSNEGRGYVLRRIIRRALRHGQKLGMDEPFFYRLVDALAVEMGEAYPQLTAKQGQIATALKQEEERFAETLGQGMRIFEAAVADLSSSVIPGEVAFQLYDTYGFPIDLTADAARERGLTVDSTGFEAAMADQRDRARAASQFGSADTSKVISAQALAQFGPDQDFVGYDTTSTQAGVVGIFVDGAPVAALTAGQEAAIVLDATPFYAEGGGQVGDRGRLKNADAAFEVNDTRKQGGVFLHDGVMKLGALAHGDRVTAEVEEPRRQATRLNHSATHLMHAALRVILGQHVEQKGSLVDPERLRFDFSHPQPVSATDIHRVERLVNEEIRKNTAVEARVMPYPEAIDRGALALFGEKYGDDVRVMRMGDFSVELCGGTHVARTGDIGFFKIVSETGVAAGVRRIEAFTGTRVLEHVIDAEQRFERIRDAVRAGSADLEQKIEQLLERGKAADKEIQQLRGQLAGQSGRDVADGAREIGPATVVAEVIAGADVSTLRTTVDRLKDRFATAVVVLGAVEDEKVRLVAGVTKNLTDAVNAGELVNFVARQVGGKGGGRPDMAQAGGSNVEGLDEAIASVYDWVADKVG